MAIRASKSPTQRSLACLRQQGFVVAVTEHFNPHVMVRQDLFGFADIIAIRAAFESRRARSFNHSAEAVLIQTTTAHNIKARLVKIKEDVERRSIAIIWLSIPAHRIELHGWKKTKQGWECETIDLTVKMLEE